MGLESKLSSRDVERLRVVMAHLRAIEQKLQVLGGEASRIEAELVDLVMDLSREDGTRDISS